MEGKMLGSGLAVSQMPIGALKPYPRNARTHLRKQIGQVAESIRTFGFNVPVLVDEENMVLAGHARLSAAKLLGLESVPCVRLAHMNKAEKKAFILADQLALNAGWDEEILSLLDKDFTLDVTGFTVAEIDGGGEPQG